MSLIRSFNAALVLASLAAPLPAAAQEALTPAQAAAKQAREERARREAAEEEAKRKAAEVKRLQDELDRLKREKAAQPMQPPAPQPATTQAASKPAAAEARPAEPASRYRPMEPVLQVAGCEACGQLSVIEAGVFEMGSPESEPEREADEGPVRKVSVARFAMGRTEVTQGQWMAVMGRNPSHFAACGDACPVEQVSWDDIAGPDGFLARLNRQLGLGGEKAYRLPSEAEWEYAARAGTRTPFWWGQAISPSQAAYDGNHVYGGGGSRGEYRSKTVRADAFEANPWGLYNVHGNVYEWVRDCRHGSYRGAPETGVAWESGCTDTRRGVRGGSWLHVPGSLRSADRHWIAPDYCNHVFGFRLARTL